MPLLCAGLCRWFVLCLFCLQAVQQLQNGISCFLLDLILAFLPDTVLDKFLKTMQTTATRLQEKQIGRASCRERKMLLEIAKRHGLELEEEAEYGNSKYLEKQDFILAKQKEQLAAQQNKLDELTLKVNDVETLIDEVSAVAYDKAVEVVTDVVRTETRKEDMRMIEDTKKWVLSPERKAPQATREYAAHRLDTVLDKFLKTMQTTATRLQEKLLKPDVRQKGKDQVKEKARDSVLQLLNRLQAEQA